MRIIVLLILAITSGCATTVGDIKAKEDVAILTGQVTGMEAALNPRASSSSVSFSSLNGESLSSLMGAVNPGTIEVPPGEHAVTVLCFIKWRGLNIRDKHEFAEVFEAGRVYYFEPELLAGGRCGLQMHTE